MSVKTSAAPMTRAPQAFRVKVEWWRVAAVASVVGSAACWCFLPNVTVIPLGVALMIGFVWTCMVGTSRRSIENIELQTRLSSLVLSARVRCGKPCDECCIQMLQVCTMQRGHKAECRCDYHKSKQLEIAS